MNIDNDFVCYIRRYYENNGWIRARTHHKEALKSFLHTPLCNTNNSVYVSVPHEDGGNFDAYFSVYENQIKNENIQIMAKYTDDYGRYVDIIIAKPSYVAYWNRLTS